MGFLDSHYTPLQAKHKYNKYQTKSPINCYLLATQSIEAWAQQDGCMQAYTIGLSINEDLKLKKRKGREG